MTTTHRRAESIRGYRRRWAVVAVCTSSTFLIGVDATIVNVGLPAIGAGLGAGARGLAWVLDAYTVALACLLITAGVAADRFGRRSVFQLGLTIFGIASLACALTPSAGLLVAARAVQGAGASMLGPVALAIIVDVLPDPRERARAIGIWASVFGLSLAAGPVTGGALLAVFSWRALFWVNVPVVVAAVVLSAVLVPGSRARRHRALDLPGQVLLTVVVGLSVFVLIEGPSVGWTSPAALVSYLVIGTAATGFVAVERRGAAPLIDPRLFGNAVFATAALGAAAVLLLLNAALLLNTYYLQQGRHWTPLATGCAILPLALAAAGCAPVAGILVSRGRARTSLLIAATSITTGALSLVCLRDDTPVAALLGAYLLIGTGIGFANAPITETAVGGLPPERAGVVGAVTATARHIGSAVGIAVAGGLVADQGGDRSAVATRPGWLLIASCGAYLFVVAALVGRTRTANRAPIRIPCRHRLSSRGSR